MVSDRASKPEVTVKGERQSGLSRDFLLQDHLVRQNLDAMGEAGQDLARTWLIKAPSSVPVTEDVFGQRFALSVGGQSQASRHDPGREAERWLDRQRERPDYPSIGESVFLFGFGNPLIVDLLLKERSVLLFEPEPLLALAVFSRWDFTKALAGRQRAKLTIMTPWHLAAEKRLESTPLLVHPPAQRRASAHLSNLRKALGSPERELSHLSGRSLRIMVVAPISGGSWPVAVSLARAVEESRHELYFSCWDDGFKQMEAQARLAGRDGNGIPVARLFEATGHKLLAEIAVFKPDLIIALAQAPLDGPHLTRLREATAAPLAFWLVEDFRHFSYVAEVAPAYDALFHIQQGALDKTLRDWGLSRSAYLPLAADPLLFKPLPAEDIPVTYRAQLSFMGAGYPNRRRLLGRLAESYWPATGREHGQFKIFGSGWEGIGGRLRRHLFEGGRRVSLPECALIYAGGRINLNIHSSFHSQPEFEPESLFVNPRTFEIAAAGAFQIVDSRPLLPDLFTPGLELTTVDEPGELTAMIDYYLENADEATALGLAARERALKEHTYSRRLDSILSFMGWQENSRSGN